MYIKPWISPVDAIILVPLVLFCDNWTISQISHCTFPYLTICNIQNKNAHIVVLNGVLCDMGHVHCGIYEISLFIISSGLAWCHHAPDLYLASNGHGRMAGCPTDLNGILHFLAGSGERGQWGKLFGSATFAGRNGRLTAPSDKICWGGGGLFQFSTDWNQILCAYWVVD